MLKPGLPRRATLGALLVTPALLLSVSGANAATLTNVHSAAAQAADCGTAKPSGETAVGSYAALKTDLGSNTAGTYYLTTSLADSPATSGGIEIGSNGQTLNLNGCSLTITNAGAANPGIDLFQSGTFTVEDLSTSHDGVLTAVGGGASASNNTWAGAGIGGGGGQAQTGTLDVISGTVNATGGASSITAGASGAGIGAGAGSGGNGGTVNVSGTGVVIATGGANSATTEEGGAGAGIGGGGSTGSNAGDGGTVTLGPGASITATGGSVSGTTVDGWPGAGIGGGGAFTDDINGGQYSGAGATMTTTGGSLTVAPGTGGGSTFAPATGFGSGGQAYANSNISQGSLSLNAGTTSLSGSFSGPVTVGGTTAATATVGNVTFDADWNVAANSTVNVTAGDTLVSAPPYDFSSFAGSLTLPATSTFDNNGQGVAFTGGTDTLSGTVITNTALEIESGASLTFNQLPAAFTDSFYVFGGTLTTPSTGTQSIQIRNSGTWNIPSGETVEINSGAADSSNDGTINLSGTLTGNGTLLNTYDDGTANGAIALKSPTASIPGNGQGANGQLTIDGNVYDLVFNVPSPGSAPASEWLFAPNLAAGNETVPVAPAVTGYVDNGGWIVAQGSSINGSTGGYPLSQTSGFPNDGVVNLAGSYQYSGTRVSQAESITVGQTINDTATVTGASYYGSPTNSVSFYECGPLTSATACSSSAGTQIGQSQSVTAGSGNTATASISLSPTQPGIYCLYAAYSGDQFNVPAGEGTTSDCETVSSGGGTGSAPVTIAKPTSSLNPSVGGEPIKLSTTVTSTRGTPTGGLVVFFNGTSTALCVTELVNGVASCDTSSAPVGTDHITAVYLGNATYAASSISAALTQTVTANSSFTVVGSSVAKASLSVKLMLSDAGTLRVAGLVGKRTFATTSKSEEVKNNTRVSLSLKLATLKKLERGHRANTKITVALRITFTPQGAKTKARTKITYVTIQVSQL